MNWEHLLSYEGEKDINRTPFDRDYDRIIFSYPFRRLQDKTQVHPLPVDDFVHTRLTHSLEVSSVGRSLGRLTGSKIVERHPPLSSQFTPHDFGAIVAAASLAHDIGNPPFGHAGESAISHFFQHHSIAHKLRSEVSESQWADLLNFEGNAQGFRLLTLRGQEGLHLTLPTLAAFTKYPRLCAIDQPDRSRRSQKKFGFFESEKGIFNELSEQVGLKQLGENQWCRHPLAFLVEAADDICYHIIDLEDGCNLGLIPLMKTRDLLAEILGDRFKPEKLEKISSTKEKVGVLRALAIGVLIEQCVNLFLEKETEILSGDFDISLTDVIPAKGALEQIIDVSINKIYRSQTVIETEAAGYEVMAGLLEVFVTASISKLEGSATHREKTFFRLLPSDTQQAIGRAKDLYTATRCLLDYVAGMTDSAAVNLFRKVKGIALPRI